MDFKRKTKIICTIGPKSAKKEVLEKLIENGMNVARLNFSHGTYQTHKENINLIREVSKKLNKFIGIMLDTKGPEIRTGNFKDNMVEYKKGSKVIITSKNYLGDSNKFQINCPELFKDIKVGDYILANDGKIRFDVLEKKGLDEIVCNVANSGILSNQKGCNVPNRAISIPFLSKKDKDDILFGIENGIDLIAASFTRCAEDILSIKKLINENSKKTVNIIAKIENEQGVENLREILKVADGIMVARGDLGVEVSLQLVPIYQKKIIKMANEFGKPVITATHMLESMITNPRPTRAEASDVANAILDGSDAIMLSGETAVGEYPLEALNTMHTISCAIENIITYDKNLQLSISSSEKTINDAIGIAVAQTALTIENTSAIIAFTETGGTAKRICKFRPIVPIIAITNSIDTARQLSYYSGVFPALKEHINNFEKFDEIAIEVSKELGLTPGSNIIITSGWAQSHGRTNTMRIIEIPKK